MGSGSAPLGGTFLSALNNEALPAALRDITTLVIADRSATRARSELYQNTRRIRADESTANTTRLQFVIVRQNHEIAATTAISLVGI
jgi:hypothetical protein